MKLYSAVRFTFDGSAYSHGEPRLITDAGNTTSVGDFAWATFAERIDALQPGHSLVEAAGLSEVERGQNSGAVMTLRAGWRITRLPDFRMSAVMFDDQAKELVLITNGKRVSPVGEPEVFAPSEAIALRVASAVDGKVTVAYTYRGVNPCYLSAVKDEQAVKNQFDAVLSRRRSARFIGRI